MAGEGSGVETATVDQLMADCPDTMRVFNAFGVDTCCGAHRTVREAASEDGVHEAALVAALQQALAAAS
ncbi:MAG: DUF542 domain-containing protein [Gemmatimonadota bacterium]